MRNALLPSEPSHLCNFGNDIDVQMSNWDAQINMNRKLGFCMGSKAFESDNPDSRAGEDFSLPLPLQSSSLLPYQPAYPSGAFRYHDGVSQQPILLDKKISAPQFEADFQAIQNARKRPIEVDDLGGLVGDKTALNEWDQNKRSKMTNSQQQWHQQFQETSMQQQNNKMLLAPVRRSQKLSDKITALQKLVSPYGKTDTASVLQEASIYIMLLQEQIQNLLRMFCSSYKNAAVLHTGMWEPAGARPQKQRPLFGSCICYSESDHGRGC
ncbi:transcription factor bHLH111-like isoform X2 [Prunus yedoensis var. nudiflora]|uniref:Transcription factor bHLH111-like isoform X2 n=1 Tax=Prunus yedoensis var. nudiflora TaxID=2094558 RepID=A0A314ZMM2_PRUYE|nr:transcription factor bHLH111-like isoform X2 [Prunus yedoensis var. nudiflora]